MQDFILDSKNKERIDRFKLALLNFERFDIEGLDLVVPDGGYFEPCFGPGQVWKLWGTLSWIQDWFVRPAKQTVNLIEYSNIRQSTKRKYTRRVPLSRLLKLQHVRDYAVTDFHVYELFRVEQEA